MATTQRVDALIRVSRKDGREGPSFRSPTQQREVCERWARDNGAELVAFHEGIGRSGKTMERADIEAVLARIQAGQTDGVVVAWINRFSRAPTDEALAICRQIEAAGGKFYPADLPGVEIGTPIGEFTLTMMLATARLQWAQTAERYNQTRREAIAEGKAIGGAPFGYRYTDPTPRAKGHGVLDSRLVPDPDRAPIVRELFERKAGGATWLELSRWLDQVAAKPNRGHWARSTVGSMIECRTYLGEVKSGEHVNATAHEAIVPLALWRRAQNGSGRRTPRGTYLLSGLVKCAGCGRNMRGSALGRKPRKGRKAPPPRVYTCDAAGCEAKSTIVVDRLDDEVVGQLFAYLDEFHVRAVSDEEVDGARVEVERLTGELEAVAGVVPSHPTAVAAHQTALAEAESRLVDAEDRLHQLTASMAADGPNVRELREDWPTMPLAVKRDVMRAAIDAILVRRAPSPTAKPPASDRALVLFHGDAPVELVGRPGPVRPWAWNGDPGSLALAA